MIWLIVFLALVGCSRPVMTDRPTQIYDVVNGQVETAFPSDLAVAQNYPDYVDKGPLFGQQRLTIMTEKTHYEVDEEVRVIHVLESTSPQSEVYVVGPKTIFEEYIDDQLASLPWPVNGGLYDGMVVPGPYCDFNYAISKYRFKSTGEHRIIWKGGGHPIQGAQGLTSNTIIIHVTK